MISLTTRSTKIKGLFYSLIIAFLIPFSAIANTDIIGTIWLDDDVNNMYDGEPGVKTIWEGYDKLLHYIEAADTLGL